MKTNLRKHIAKLAVVCGALSFQSNVETSAQHIRLAAFPVESTYTGYSANTGSISDSQPVDEPFVPNGAQQSVLSDPAVPSVPGQVVPYEVPAMFPEVITQESVGGESCGGNGSCSCESLLANTEWFMGGDSFASIGESNAGGFNNNFGLVTGFNTGLRFFNSPTIRAQFGGSYGAYDLKGRTGVVPSSLEEQVYLTAGLYKRGDIDNCDRISWGLVYDELFADNWGTGANDFALGQVRGLLGYALSPCNEVGAWGTLRTQEQAAVIGTPTSVHAMNQLNTYWRHHWDFGASSMFYTGVLDGATVGDWQFGMQSRAPLSNCASLYSNFNYVVPSVRTGLVGDVEDQWSVSAGLVFFFGAKSVSPNVQGQYGLPLMPVANNSSFLITN